jgi:hypothetical protein
MTQTAAIALALLKGEVISIKTAFNQFGCTNAPREIGRSIERKFGVVVSKTPVKFKSRYGKSGVYFQYRLNRTKYNQDGIRKMVEYVESHMEGNPKTQAQQKAKEIVKQLQLL